MAKCIVSPLFCLLILTISGHRKSSTTAEFPAFCTEAKHESPIDLSHKHAFKQDFNKIPPLQLKNFDREYEICILHNGHTVDIFPNDMCMCDSIGISGAGLRNRYTFDSLHFHWPSENTIDGFRYSNYSEVSGRVAHGNSEAGHVGLSLPMETPGFQDAVTLGAVTVLGVLHMQNSVSGNAIGVIAESVGPIAHKPGLHNIADKKIKFRDMLPYDIDSFFMYCGGLTTTINGTETVNWIVFEKHCNIENLHRCASEHSTTDFANRWLTLVDNARLPGCSDLRHLPALIKIYQGQHKNRGHDPEKISCSPGAEFNIGSYGRAFIMDTHALVLDVLQRASSQNPDILKPAEIQLKEWEVQPGFYSTLLNVISNHQLDVNVRWIAVLYMKNGIDKYWRKTAPNAISDEEKQTIRQNLLTTFTEPINQIAVQRAVLISKVARSDCPKEWPELFPTLLQAVESSDQMVQHRALLTMHHVIKAISSKRLAGDRKIFQDFTNNIFTYVLNLWNTLSQAFIDGVIQGASPEIITLNIEKALLTLRVLRKLAIFGFYKPHQSEVCMGFFKMIFERCKTMLICWKQIKGKPGCPQEPCEKYIIHLTKVLLSTLDIHPYSFVSLIQPALELTSYYLFTDEGISFLFERFAIQCFNLIKNILVCAEYTAAKIPEFTKNPETLKAHQIKQNFLQPQTVLDICRKLVGHYFILTHDELELWDSDPEAFSNDEGGDSWKYSLRPSMETVFVTIFHEFREVLTPVMLEMIAETDVVSDPENMQHILRKDAIYNAAGLCAFDLYDEIMTPNTENLESTYRSLHWMVDFDRWFSKTLVQELKIKHNNYRIIRRRVAALIGRWTGIKLSTELRPALYDCVINLLGRDEDMAVRLTAASTLRYAIDDFEFSSEHFDQYKFPAFNSLFELLKEATECETKMQVLNVMTLLLERMGTTMMPHSDALIQYLPLLWQESEEHNMLRCAIVATLVQLVKSMGGVPQEMGQFLLPIIKMGTDTTGNAIVYLLEDALDLWLAVLEYSPSMTPELMELFTNMPRLLDSSTENMRTCFYICLVHLLIAPELVMRTQGLEIVQICDSTMGDLKNEGVILLMRLIESFIRAMPLLGAETTMPILPRIVKRILDGEDTPLVMSMFLCILSRVLLSSPEVFGRVISKLAEMHNETEQVTLGRILDVWLSKMTNVSQLDQRKLLALALTNLLTRQSPQVYERFNLVMLNIAETLNDITKQDDGGLLTDSLVLTEGQSPSHFDDDGPYYETDHDQRKKQLILNDPVHTIVLKDYLQSQIVLLRNQTGIQYQQLWNTVQPDVINQLKEYVSI